MDSSNHWLLPVPIQCIDARIGVVVAPTPADFDIDTVLLAVDCSFVDLDCIDIDHAEDSLLHNLAAVAAEEAVYNHIEEPDSEKEVVEVAEWISVAELDNCTHFQVGHIDMAFEAASSDSVALEPPSS